MPVIKTIASAITIGSGGSAGKEGPIAQIGAGFGSFLASVLKVSDRERRIMVLAGAAAGIGAIFKAPSGRGAFRHEVLYGREDFEFEAIIPCILSSIVGFMVYTFYDGTTRIFHIPRLALATPAQLPFLCGARRAVRVRRIPLCPLLLRHPRPVFQAPRSTQGREAGDRRSHGRSRSPFFCPKCSVGAIRGCSRPSTGSSPFDSWRRSFSQRSSATSFTISSGGSGGVFAPSLFIGSMLGGAFGNICQRFFPHIVTEPGAFVLVGMGGFFAGVAKVPIAALIMVAEMTGGYSLIVPMMIVTSLSYLLLGNTSLYEKQVADPRRFSGPRR